MRIRFKRLLSLGAAVAVAAIGVVAEAPASQAAGQPHVTYTAYVPGSGWQGWVSDGQVAGVPGKGLRMDATRIKLSGAPGSSIQYQVSVQSSGWMPAARNGLTGGTTGRGLRMEAIAIRLTGPIAQQYSVWYRTSVSGLGWQGWVSDGQVAGVPGRGQRLEALQITLKLKGTAVVAPSGPPPAATTGVTYFVSPSRNIGCGIDGNQAQCTIRSHGFAPVPPAKSCSGSAWQPDTFVVWGSGSQAGLCAGAHSLGWDSLYGGKATNTLPAGKHYTQGSITCTTSADGAAMTCATRNGSHGFTISVSSYKTW